MSARVAVLMAVRDGGAALRAALASVADQTYRNREVVLVDDGSTDGAVEGVRGPWLDLHLHAYRTAPTGLTKSLNFAAGRVFCRNPTYFARLDADDTWAPGKLERQVRFMDANPQVVLLGGCWQLPDGQICGPPHVDDTGLRQALRWRNPFAHSTVLIRTSAFDRVGGYDESFPVAQDWELWVRLARVGRLVALPDVLATLGQGPHQVTRRRPWARRWHGWRIRWRARSL